MITLPSQVNLPLSGNVAQPLAQTFAPWMNFTFNVGQSSSPTIEPDALSVANYGKQLSRIGDALIVLFKHVRREHQTTEDEAKISDLKTMLHEIANVKEKRGAKRVLRPS